MKIKEDACIIGVTILLIIITIGTAVIIGIEIGTTPVRIELRHINEVIQDGGSVWIVYENFSKQTSFDIKGYHWFVDSVGKSLMVTYNGNGIISVKDLT